MPKIKRFRNANVQRPGYRKGSGNGLVRDIRRSTKRSLIFSMSYAGAKSWSVLYYDENSRPRRKLLGFIPTSPTTERRLSPSTSRRLSPRSRPVVSRCRRTMVRATRREEQAEVGWRDPTHTGPALTTRS